jgi:uncharacterized protein (TIGR02145 family)/prepilin-type N-terminal cleavage/methylation domain-containing protein
MKPNKKAFTLIELLVVIAIIGILTTVAVIALNNARAKSRDAKRVADVKQVQTALELFFNDNQRYPTAEEWATGKIYSTSTGSTSTYMQIIPATPTPSDGSCTNDQNAIFYQSTEDGASYTISFCLGNTTGSLTPGPKCLTPAGIIDVNCGVGSGSSLVCGQNIIDSRDGKTYPTVGIGTQCWMAESLDVGTRIDALSSAPCTLATVGSYTLSEYAYSCQQNDSEIEKYCYDNDDNKCLEYGGLYEWTEAMQLPVSCANVAVDCDSSPSDPCCNYNTPRQGICPSGWHIPSGAEFMTLYSIFGGTSIAGDALKEVGFTHWDNNNTAATNASGFTALAAGRFGKNGFNSAPGSPNGAYNMIWTSDANGDLSDRAYIYSGSDVDVFEALRDRGLSVRCVADQAISCTPNCSGKCSGFDGCGGTCPDNCTGGQECSDSHVCACLDDSCGSSCSACAPACSNSTSCGDDCSYENRNYSTASINGECWFRKNLNVGVHLCSIGTSCTENPDDVFDYDNIQKYCYSNSSDDCAVYGGLYPWPEAMGLPDKCKSGAYTCGSGTCTHNSDSDCNYPDPASIPRQGICPSGWHIPSGSEWMDIINYTGGGGIALKAASPAWNGNDTYNFTALPAGYHDGSSGGFGQRNSEATFWSSSHDGPQGATGYGFFGSSNGYGIWHSYRYSGYSVRCTKD